MAISMVGADPDQEWDRQHHQHRQHAVVFHLQSLRTVRTRRKAADTVGGTQ